MRMTIHRALSELKLINKKIEKAYQNLEPVGVYQKDKLVNQRIKQEDFKSAAVSSWDSLTTLISNKNKIKSAIVMSNAVNKIKIGDRELTVAEAITEKDNIPVYKEIVSNLRKKIKLSENQMDQLNEKVKNNCQAVVEATVGKDNIIASKDQVDSISKSFMETNTIHLFDPLEINKKLDEMEKQYMEFEMNVDACLSESNAIKTIEI